MELTINVVMSTSYKTQINSFKTAALFKRTNTCDSTQAHVPVHVQ